MQTEHLPSKSRTANQVLEYLAVEDELPRGPATLRELQSEIYWPYDRDAGYEFGSLASSERFNEDLKVLREMGLIRMSKYTKYTTHVWITDGGKRFVRTATNQQRAELRGRGN